MAKVQVDIGGDASGAVGAFDRVSAATIAAGNIMADLVSRGIDLAARAFTGLAEQAGVWVEASNEQENAIARLRTALATAGEDAAHLTDVYGMLASEFQAATAFGDEKILEGISKLVTIGGVHEEQMQATTQAALDLAAGLKIDLDSAFTLVAKAATGNTQQLQRYGIQVEKSADKTQQLDNVLAALGGRFGGQATAEAETFQGQITSLKNVIGETYEVLGDLIKEVIEPLLPILKDAALLVQAWVGEMKPQIIDAMKGALIGMADGALLAAKAGLQLAEAYGSARSVFAEFLAGALEPVIRGLQSFAQTVAEVAEKLGLDGLAMVMSDVSDTLGDLHLGLDANVEDQKRFATATSEAVEKLEAQAQALRDNVVAAVETAGATDKVSSSVQQATTAVGDLDKVTKGYTSGSLSVIGTQWERATEKTKESQKAMEEYYKQLEARDKAHAARRDASHAAQLAQIAAEADAREQRAESFRRQFEGKTASFELEGSDERIGADAETRDKAARGLRQQAKTGRFGGFTTQLTAAADAIEEGDLGKLRQILEYTKGFANVAERGNLSGFGAGGSLGQQTQVILEGLVNRLKGGGESGGKGLAREVGDAVREAFAGSEGRMGGPVEFRLTDEGGRLLAAMVSRHSERGQAPARR